MSEQKPKKPFLKRGTRQFLSNAQVRSLNQKPKIVEFNDEDFEKATSPFANNNPSKKQNKEDIVISVKPKNIPRDKSQSSLNKAKQNTKKMTNNQPERTKQSRNQSKIEEHVGSSTTSANNSHSSSKVSQKKPTLLADYLNNDSKPAAKKSAKQAPIILPFAKTNPIKSYQPVIHQSQAQHLKMQDIDDDSDEDNHAIKNKKKNHRHQDEEENEFMMKRANDENSPEELKKIEPSKKKPNLLQQGFQNKREKQNLNLQNQKVDEKSEQNDVNFNSDSDQDEKHKKNQFKTKANKSLHQNRFNKQINENQDDDENSDNQDQVNRKATVKLGTKPQSKVTQMFNKNSNQKTNNQAVTEPEPVKSKMTVKDIPQELIEELVNMYFSQAKQKYQKKQQNLFQQVKIVEKKQESLNEQEKNLEKRIKQHEKLIEEKNKQFQNKIKSQQSKITREKMYLKDQQTTGKVDWKTKNEIQELKQQLEEERNERKRIETKLKGQLDRLKTRFNEQMEINKNLQNRIKQYELRDIKQRQMQVKEQKQQKQETIKRKQGFWQDAPKRSYLQRFFSNDFSLSQLSIEDYLYTKNEFYKYYEHRKDQGVLQMQQNEGNKIKRTYDNGKIEIQSPSKFVKQVFPWGFIIVHYINGDVKQVIQFPKQSSSASNKQMEIYFAKNSYIIEYSIADGKRIHYFLNDDQVEFNNQLIDLKEVFTGNQLQRSTLGNVKTFQKNAKGNFVEIY